MRSLEAIMLHIARLAIMEVFLGKPLIDREELIREYPQLAEKQAVFVTLNKQEGGRTSLRGCIGSIIPYRSLIDDIIYNARAAAFEDPRFPPLKEEELEHIKIEISLLTIPRALSYSDTEDLRRKIVPGKYGVILKFGGRQATFLPQVWEQLPEFDLFFQQLCLKAGLPGNCLKWHPEIDVYEVKKFEEP